MEISSANPFPVGFRFQPSEEELVLYYLKYKALNLDFYDPTQRFRELELYDYTPQQLREIYGTQKEREMYFFVKKVLKYSTGKRLQRRTAGNGHWRASTKEIDIEFDGHIVGHRRNLVYHKGEGRGEKTNWLMCEYRLPDDMIQLGEWLLCKVYLNEKEQLESHVNLVLEPPVSKPNPSSNIVGPTSTVNRLPEPSSSFSVASNTEQFTDIHRSNSEKIVIQYDDAITTDTLFEQAEYISPH